MSLTSDGGDVIPVLSSALHEAAASAWAHADAWAPVEQTLEAFWNSLTGALTVPEGSYRSSFIYYTAGSGKTLAFSEAARWAASADKGASEPFFTPRSVVRQVARAVHLPSHGRPNLSGTRMITFGEMPWRRRQRPDMSSVRRCFSDPRPVSSDERRIGSGPPDGRNAPLLGESSAPGARRLDQVRHLICAFLRTLTPTWKRRAQAIFAHLSCLLAALRSLRAVIAVGGTIVPAGARAASVRGGPRGPDRLPQSTCQTYTGGDLASA